jgi:hypothetical protein
VLDTTYRLLVQSERVAAAAEGQMRARRPDLHPARARDRGEQDLERPVAGRRADLPLAGRRADSSSPRSARKSEVSAIRGVHVARRQNGAGEPSPASLNALVFGRNTGKVRELVYTHVCMMV